MHVERVTTLAATDGHSIPAYLLAPYTAQGGAVLIPPYGATKEHMLGIAVTLGEAGIATLAIDLCGHGENSTAIGPVMRDEVESAIRYIRRFGPAAALGISLGGRLALMSSADCMVAISPSVVAAISPQGKWMFETFPSPTVREPYAGYVVELLDALGPVPPHDRPCLVLYAERGISQQFSRVRSDGRGALLSATCATSRPTCPPSLSMTTVLSVTCHAGSTT